MHPRNFRAGSTLWIVIALIACVALAAGWWLFGGRGVPAIEDNSGRQIADAFLSKIREGNPQLAWDETAAEFKSDIGREDFVRYVRRQPVLKETLEFQSLAPLPDKPIPLMESTFQSPAKEGQPGQRIRVWLGVDQGAWKVERLFVDQAN